VIPAYIAKNLKSHQIEGIEFMWKHIAGKAPGGCILAHSMGLGKSLQVCTVIHAFCKRQMARNPASAKQAQDPSPYTARVMLVVPSSLLDNWSNEFRKWVNKSVSLVPGFLRQVDVWG